MTVRLHPEEAPISLVFRVGTKPASGAENAHHAIQRLASSVRYRDFIRDVTPPSETRYHDWSVVALGPDGTEVRRVSFAARGQAVLAPPGVGGLSPADTLTIVQFTAKVLNTALLAGHVDHWLAELLPPSGYVDPTAARLRTIRAQVEALTGALRLSVLENVDLQERLSEREAFIAQLEAQVKTLNEELDRRKSLSPKRVGLCGKVIIDLLVTAVGTFGGSACLVIAEQHFVPVVQQTQHPAGETFRRLVQDCEQLNAEIRAYEKSAHDAASAPIEPGAAPRS